MKKIILVLVFCLLSVGAVAAQNNFSITSNSVGFVRLGMTVNQARTALKGYKLKRTSDGEGVSLIEVSRNGKAVMNLFAGEADAGDAINGRAKIEFIEVTDTSYKTADGVHPQMMVKEVERRLGKLKKIEVSEIEQREFATFAKKPKNLSFLIRGDEGDYAGIYAEGKRESTKTNAAARIYSISVAQ
ncbi:MAG TPA: hypothetical protein VNI84_03900 [Pyrinomonadaceae bacterium]|nr:hypothetical protein [Pyrinomonadaceae bacterium]